MRRFEAVLVTEVHGRFLDLGDRARGVDFPLAALYETPLCWRAYPGGGASETEIDPQIRGVCLSRLLEMQALAPGLVTRYVIGFRFCGQLEGEAKLAFSFGSLAAEEGKLSGRPSYSAAVVSAARREAKSVSCIISDAARDYMLTGPVVPFDFLRARAVSSKSGTAMCARNYVISYGVSVVALLAGAGQGARPTSRPQADCCAQLVSEVANYEGGSPFGYLGGQSGYGDPPPGREVPGEQPPRREALGE